MLALPPRAAPARVMLTPRRPYMAVRRLAAISQTEPCACNLAERPFSEVDSIGIVGGLQST
eukprot:15454896-Alexandrium_andersonii.AAC.1